ncbi:MAG: DUF484 family protein, partial [Gammaproteobacteria bacterium]|nr:DUF484 family protein [Gammaproteobacteria bacterium]
MNARSPAFTPNRVPAPPVSDGSVLMSRGRIPRDLLPRSTRGEGFSDRLLNQLFENAAHNQQVMRRFLKREMSLLTANGLVDLIEKLTIGTRAGLSLDAVGLALFDPHDVLRDMLTTLGSPAHQLQDVILLRDPRRFTGPAAPGKRLRLEDYDVERHGWLLGPGRLRRVAMLPLRRPDGLVGYLCLGTRDPARFISEHATDLLERLSLVAALSVENACNAERLRLASLIDPLTGLFNRRMLHQRLSEETARATRYGQPISCLFVDVDHFKRIND